MDGSEKKAARAILAAFKKRGLRSGGFLNFNEFGTALHWEAGHIKHDNQRNALRYLVERGFVMEVNSGLELTDKGAKSLEKL
jgi:hypothetical protein